MNKGFQKVRIAGRDYAAGLFWQVLSKAGKGEILSLGTKLNFDLMAHDISGVNAQVGFAASQDGAQIGLPSLALQLIYGANKGRKTKLKDFLVLIELGPDVWYLLAVREGVIQANTDGHGTETVAIDRLLSFVKREIPWEVVFGPESLTPLNIPNLKPFDLKKWLKRPRSGANLSGLSSPPLFQNPKIIWAIAGFIVLIALGGVVGYWLHLEELKRTEQQRQDLMEAERLKKPPLPSWYEQPSATNFLQQCLSKFAVIKPGGWTLESFECTAKQTKSEYARQSGNLAAFMLAEPNAVIATNQDKATLIEPMAGRWAVEASPVDDLNPAYIRLASNLQQLEIKSTIKPPTDTGDKVPGQTERTVQVVEFTIDASGYGPSIVINILPASTRIQKLVWKSDNWNLTGNFYAFKN